MDTDTVATAIAYAGAGVALAGLLFVLVGVGSVVVDASPEYAQHISDVEDSPSAAPTDSDYEQTTQSREGVFRYSNLSDRGQTVFDRTRRAYERNGSDYAFGPDEAQPPEFDYPTDYSRLGHGTYYVVYDGQYYRLSTHYRRTGGFGGALFGLVLVSTFGVPLLGFGALVLAGYALWRRTGD